jgi:DNA (cytosine-5)-methyltransferase 1
VENDRHACATLRSIRRWKHAVRETDLRDFCAARYEDIDLVAGGVPCPPFSRAGRRLGDHQDERDLFPEALRIVGECDPRAVMIENVCNLLGPEFSDYRASVLEELARLDYVADWRLPESCDYDVPQLRPRAVLALFGAI